MELRDSAATGGRRADPARRHPAPSGYGLSPRPGRVRPWHPARPSPTLSASLQPHPTSSRAINWAKGNLIVLCRLGLEGSIPTPSKPYPPAKSRRSGTRGVSIADRLVPLQVLKEGFRCPLMALNVPMPIESEASILDPASLADDVVV